MSYQQSLEFSSFLARTKHIVWSFGVLAWLLGIAGKGVTSLADRYLSITDLLHLSIASFLFITWLVLKPEKSLSRSNANVLQSYQSNSQSHQKERYLCTAQARMFELQEQHMISQEYTLPFPYLCQIYHLLNLKHLEKIHDFSLSNLRITEVSHFQATTTGGVLKFKTILDSPFNALRVWRQPTVEVGLTLHTPYTVELSIPVYNHRKIIIIFNALPLNQNEHKLFIDIYSNLEWPKLFLQILLHFASCLTLFEDLPYLRKLAKRNLRNLANLDRISSHEMWLFRRFIDLYGSSAEFLQLA